MIDDANLRIRLREDTRYRVLRLIEDNPSMSQRDLARAVGVSLGGLNYVLGALVERGLVKMSNFAASRDRRRYLYVLTQKGIAEKAQLTRKFLARKLEEYEALSEEIASLQAEIGDPGTEAAR